MKTICLNMIVKNEHRVIQRCLASVRDKIDYWVIVDTGSTDGTQELIREFLKDIPGELHEKPWVNFEQNRNEALSFAKDRGDYLLFIDADERLVFLEEEVFSSFEFDCYLIDIHQENRTIYQRIALINNHLNWAWEGVLHEEIKSRSLKSCGLLKGVYNLSVSSEGARAKDPKKYHKDAEILRKALKKDPQNCRYTSFLALCYDAIHEDQKALEMYQRRISLAGEDVEEIFYALYRIGVMQERLQMDEALFVKSYCQAYLFRPSRAEPLFALVKHYMRSRNDLMGYLISEFAMNIPLPKDRIYVEDWIYTAGLCSSFRDCAFYVGRSNQTGTISM